MISAIGLLNAVSDMVSLLVAGSSTFDCFSPGATAPE